MLLVCAVTKSLAGIATRSCPAFTNTVERGDPFHVAIDPGTKFDPTIVSHVFPLVVVALLGVT